MFRALCDAQYGNDFFNPPTVPATKGATTDDYVNAVFNQLLLQRSPNFGVSSTITLNDSPFWSIGTGPFDSNPAGTNPPPAADALVVARGLVPTQSKTITKNPFNVLNLLGPNNQQTNGSLNLIEPFVAGAPPTPLLSIPIQRAEMLNKIFNNLTTRSNTFAVFLTVGFFEVVDDSVRPVRLGAEIGASENRQIRHHMIAIIDRTQLQVLNFQLPGVFLIPDPKSPTQDHVEVQPAALDPISTTNPHEFGYIPQGMMQGPNPVQKPQPKFGPNIMSPIQDPRTGRFWTLQAGSVLVLEPGTANEETVVLEAEPSAVAFPNDPPRLRYRILKAHSQTMNVIVRGNPGPMPKYNARNDPSVVPFVAVID